MNAIARRGPPFVHDLDAGRRYASIDDFRRLVQIHHSIPWLHHSGGIMCEPVDIPANKRHLDMLYHHIRCSDRPFMGAFIREARAQDTVDMAKILFGREFMREQACLYAVSNTNAPLVLDAAMSGSLKVYARNNQPVASGLVFCLPGEQGELIAGLTILFSMWQCAGHGDAAGFGFGFVY